MRTYTRALTPGGTFFFTVNLADRSGTLLTDHLHAIWTLPSNDMDYPTRWALIKAGFSRSLPKTERISPSRTGKGERGIWQRRYWEHQIRDETDYARHVDYIHYNPVKHGHVESPFDWPHSSIHRFIKEGILPPDWGASYVAQGWAEWGE
ncbi:MAG: transposase [Nitrosospira sp.]|nr:transposase [Nitrosospira sp.]